MTVTASPACLNCGAPLPPDAVNWGALVSRSVTDAQIRQLADEAGWHADYAMSAICDIALGGDGVDRRMDDAQRAIVACFRTRRGLPRQAAARRECARVIAEARAVRR